MDNSLDNSLDKCFQCIPLEYEGSAKRHPVQDDTSEEDEDIPNAKKAPKFEERRNTQVQLASRELAIFVRALQEKRSVPTSTPLKYEENDQKPALQYVTTKDDEDIQNARRKLKFRRRRNTQMQLPSQELDKSVEISPRQQHVQTCTPIENKLTLEKRVQNKRKYTSQKDEEEDDVSNTIEKRDRKEFGITLKYKETDQSHTIQYDTSKEDEDVPIRYNTSKEVPDFEKYHNPECISIEHDQTSEKHITKDDTSEKGGDAPNTKKRPNFKEFSNLSASTINDKEIPQEIQDYYYQETVQILEEENKLLHAQIQKYYDTYPELKDNSEYEDSNLEKKLLLNKISSEYKLHKLKEGQQIKKAKHSHNWEKQFITNQNCKNEDGKIDDLATEYTLLSEMLDKLNPTRKMQEHVNYWKQCIIDNQQSIMTTILERYKDSHELEKVRKLLNELQNLCNMIEEQDIDIMLMTKALCTESRFQSSPKKITGDQIINFLELTHVDDQNPTSTYYDLLEICNRATLIINKIIDITLRKELNQEVNEKSNAIFDDKLNDTLCEELDKDSPEIFKEELNEETNKELNKKVDTKLIETLSKSTNDLERGPGEKHNVESSEDKMESPYLEEIHENNITVKDVTVCIKVNGENIIVNKKIKLSEKIEINISIIAEKQVQTDETDKTKATKQTERSEQDFMSSKIPNSNNSTFFKTEMDYITNNPHILVKEDRESPIDGLLTETSENQTVNDTRFKEKMKSKKEEKKQDYVFPSLLSEPVDYRTPNEYDIASSVKTIFSKNNSSRAYQSFDKICSCNNEFSNNYKSQQDNENQIKFSKTDLSVNSNLKTVHNECDHSGMKLRTKIAKNTKNEMHRHKECNRTMFEEETKSIKMTHTNSCMTCNGTKELMRNDPAVIGKNYTEAVIENATLIIEEESKFTNNIRKEVPTRDRDKNMTWQFYMEKIVIYLLLYTLQFCTIMKELFSK